MAKSKLAKKHRRMKRIAKLFAGGNHFSEIGGSSLEHYITEMIISLKLDNKELRQQRRAFPAEDSRNWPYSD